MNERMTLALRAWYRLSDNERHEFLTVVRSDPKPGHPIPESCEPKSAEFRIRRHTDQGV